MVIDFQVASLLCGPGLFTEEILFRKCHSAIFTTLPMTTKSAMALGSNESRPPAKYQSLYPPPSLNILQPTLDAVVELEAVFTSPDDSSSRYCPAEVISHLRRVLRKGFAIFIQSDLLITSSQILSVIDGYDLSSITCCGVECFVLKMPSRLQSFGLHHLSYLRLKTVGIMHLSNVAIVHPFFLHPFWVSYHVFL